MISQKKSADPSGVERVRTTIGILIVTILVTVHTYHHDHRHRLIGTISYSDSLKTSAWNG